MKKMTDAIMKAEFQQPKGTHAYYMVRNCDKRRVSHLNWYLDKACLLAKATYMFKEAFAPLYAVKRGIKIDWATWVLDRTQLGEIKDKRRMPTQQRGY